MHRESKREKEMYRKTEIMIRKGKGTGMATVKGVRKGSGKVKGEAMAEKP